MTPERWEQISRVYNAAMARAASDRSAFVAKACVGDAALRREVELLLAQATVATTKESLAQAEELLRITKLREKTGTGLPADVIRATAQLEERRGDMITAIYLARRI